VPSAFDQSSKAILEASLAEGGYLHRETEVSPDAQRIDVWYVPEPSRPRPTPPGHLLERMARGPCTFEPFSSTPGDDHVLACIRKQLNFLHIQSKAEAGLHPLPHQWLLSPGRPKNALRGIRAFSRRGWPRGVYDVAPLLRTSIVVISELPEETSTLAVRLMGRGQTFRRAAKELRSLPEDAFERRMLLPILVKYRLEVRATKASPEDKEFIMATESIMEVWERRIAASARLDGERRTVLRMLRSRFGELSPNVARVVENADEESLDRFTDRLFSAKTPEDVIA